MQNKTLIVGVAMAMAWSAPALAGKCGDELAKFSESAMKDPAYYRTINSGKRAQFYRKMADAARELDAKGDEVACTTVLESMKRQAAADAEADKKVDVTAYEKEKMKRIAKGKTFSEFRGGLVRARNVQHKEAVSTDAKPLGTVDDVWVIDGKYYFVVAKEGALGSKSTRYIVPAKAARVTEDGETVIIGVAHKDFAKAPVLQDDDDNITRAEWKKWQMINQKFYNDVSTYR